MYDSVFVCFQFDSYLIQLEIYSQNVHCSFVSFDLLANACVQIVSMPNSSTN